MRRGEIATSTIIYITLGLVVLIILIIGMSGGLKDGFNFFGDQSCRASADSDGDGTVDSLDTYPCDADHNNLQWTGADRLACQPYKDNCK